MMDKPGSSSPRSSSIKSPSKTPTLEKCVLHLQSKHSAVVHQALLCIRHKYIKDEQGPKYLLRKGGVSQILQLACPEGGASSDSKKIQDVAMSILGNLATLKDVRCEIVKCGAVEQIGNIMMTSSSDSIQNRACRTLGNLAYDFNASCAIHQKPGLLRRIVSLLKASESKENLQTLVRSLRVLSNTCGHMYRVLQARSLEAIIGLLSSTSNSVLSATLHTLTHLINVFHGGCHFHAECEGKHDYSWEIGASFVNEDEIVEVDSTEKANSENEEGDLGRKENLKGGKKVEESEESGKMEERGEKRSHKELEDAAHKLAKPIRITLNQCQEELTRQLVHGENLSLLVEIAQRDNASLCKQAISLLLLAIKVPLLRPLVGNSGAIPFFIQSVKDDEFRPRGDTLRFVNAMAISCQDVVNRCRVRESGGLELILQLLNRVDWARIHNRLISALVCFIYDESSLQVLLSQEMCISLVSHLCRCADLTSCEPEAVVVKSPECSSQNAIGPWEVGTAESLSEDDGEPSSTSLRPKSEAKYSMDSPTYQEISQRQMESGGYDPDAPTNLWDSGAQQGLNYQKSPSVSPPSSPSSSCSPGRVYSPMSTVSYQSPEWHSSAPSSPAASQMELSEDSSTLSQSTISPTLGMSPLQRLSPSLPGSLEADSWSPRASEPPPPSSPLRVDIGALSPHWMESSSFSPVDLHFSSQSSCTSPQRKKHRGSTPDSSLRPYPASDSTPRPASTLSASDLMMKLNEEAKAELMDHVSIDPHIHRDPNRLTQHNVLVLLSRVSYLPDPSPHLVQPVIIQGLLDYVAHARRPLTRVSRLLNRLTSSNHCFERMVQTLAPLAIHLKLHRKIHASSQSCQGNDTLGLCNQLLANLSVIMASQYGQGTMVHMLLSSQPEKRQRAAVCLPFICRGHEQEQKLLVDVGGLNLLLDTIFIHPVNDDLFPSVVHSLACIIHSHATQSFEGHTNSDERRSRSNRDGDLSRVDFQLDDETKVNASCKIMIQKSRVFEAMLTGDYREAGKSVVRLQQVPSRPFAALVDILHHEGEPLSSILEKHSKAAQCETPVSEQSQISLLSEDESMFSDSQGSYQEELISDPTLLLLLDILALTNRFLMTELHFRLCQHMADYHFNPSTVVAILEFALHHNSPILVKRCLLFILADDSLTVDARMQLVRKLTTSALQGEIRKNVHSLLLQVLASAKVER